MQAKVVFRLRNPIPVMAQESYASLGIEAEFVGSKLVSVGAIVDHALGTGSEQIIEHARSHVLPLLTLVGWAYGISADVEKTEIQTVVAASTVPGSIATSISGYGTVSADAICVRQFPMPSVKTVNDLELSDVRRRQLDAYLDGLNSRSVVERIKYFYLVLEYEKWLTCDWEPEKRYKPPDDFRFLRNAVSHAKLCDANVKNHLQKHIGSDHIDAKNQIHMRFLQTEQAVLCLRAKEILDRDMKWW